MSVSIPQHTLSGKFSKTVYVETDVPGQEFLKLTVSGTAVPVVEVLPERAVYLGRLEPGILQTFMFRLIPAAPDISLRLLPYDDGAVAAETSLVREEDGAYALGISFTPDSSMRHVSIRRELAVDCVERDIPPIRLSVMFSVRESAGPAE